ncbi:protein TASOR isoform X5 [Echinops telfairi]|uniref:Protein TASOR isoform X5 n=1 Tax=Echinops telfairi TaxID=9371 RepID=A0AC55D261_ECHTE|nr:protein TASOR isoform X5 [Echinops telfairi]
MATAVGMEASPATDASWEGGGSGGDDGIKQAFPEPESSPQNGGDGVLSIAEPGGGGGGTAPEETAAAKASAGLSHAQLPDASEAGAAALLKGPEEPERPVRRSFQIPRKSREKKALFQPLTPSSREFEDVLNILHSSYLEPTSVANFNYKRACLIHNELLEKEFTEKRRELKFDGRLDKELSESYAFLMVDRHQVQSICEKGLQVGQSKITILGSPSMGIYLSRYADLLQANPLEAGAMGDVVIFKIMKGKIKSIYDPMGVKSLESMLNKNTLDPTPKHECHMSKNANRITSLLAYRAYELTQYYFYEYGFDELRRRPRHVCPYAVVSFNYKDDIQTPKFISSSRSNSFNADRNTDKFNYTLWKGQLLNKGKLLCYISLRSATRAFLPIKLPEKLDVETVMSIDHLKQKIPPSLFYKDIYVGPNEVLKNGMYCSLYEVVEKTRVGSNMESLLLKLEKEKLVLVKLLGDRGFLFLLSPCQMISPYEYQTVKSRALHALFLFQEPRSIVPSQKGFTSTVPQERHESVSDVLKITQFLQFSLIQCRKEFKNINSINFHSVVDKYVSEFFKRGFGSGKREFTMFPYDSRLDDKKFLYSAPKNKSHIDDCLHTYIFRPEMYQLPICQLKELFEENRRFQQLSPLSDYEGQEEVNGAKMKFRKRNNSKGEMSTSGKQKSSHSLDYDKDRVKELINLIQCRKKNVGGDSDTEDMKSKAILKRKLEDLPENMRKLAKTSDLSENCHLFEESPQLAGSLSGGLGHDADVRGQQQGTSNSGVADIHRVFDWLSETLANARHSDTPLTDTVNKALGLSIEGASEETRQKQEQELNITQDKKECEQPTCAKIENVHFKDSQSPLLDVDTLSLKYPIAVSTSEGDMDHKLHLKEMMENTCGTRFEECDSVWKVMEKEEEKKKPPGSFDPDTIPAMEMAAVSIRNSPRKEERNARRSSATLPTWGQVKLMSTWAEIALTNTDKPITPENLFLTMITVIPAAPGDPNLINMDNFEDCSLCPSEHGFGRQPSKSNTVEEPEIHWKLIPITGGNARSPEDQLGKQGEKQTPGMKSPEDQLVCLPPQEAFPNDPRVISRQRSSDYQFPSSPFTDTLKGTTEEDVLTGQVVTVEEQCDPAPEPPTLSETIERTVLGEYNLFSRKIEEILKEKNVPYVSKASTPIFSTQEKIKRLSEFIYSKTSRAGVQEFVDGLHEKLNSIIIKASANVENLPPASPNDSGTKKALSTVGRHCMPVSSSYYNNKCLPASLCSDALKDTSSHEQPSSSALHVTAEEMNQPYHATEPMVMSDHTVPGNTARDPVEKDTTKSPSDVNINAPPALSNFISQLEPEVFNSLVKIMKDVQKNTVKFYIHEDEESVLCKEIKVPGLVMLKKLPCVSFAGVDSLDDVKNHTYNELFVSGGFIVSDESVLNPDVITIENLKIFLTFLEELSTPEGKWQWKVHCKFQKKLKELGRLNTKALSLLTLLNVYQKKHLVEILSYHICDSQTRNAPELDCLIRLQAQNIQQRHIVFLTEKNIKMFSSYADNGIVVATTEDFMQNFKSLVGYHNTNTEENHPILAATENHESQSALLESAEKDEEDMSLDSGDEISQIEVCSNFHSEILAKETKGSRGTEQKKNVHTELQSSPDMHKSLLEDKTYENDFEEQASVDRVCPESDENSHSAEQDLHSNFQLNMSHQFSHFNVLTHQTFLGTPYASRK